MVLCLNKKTKQKKTSYLAHDLFVFYVIIFPFPMSLNRELQRCLTDEFKPRGIVAFSNCCRLGCTGTYEDGEGLEDNPEIDEPEFQLREDEGIYFFRLHLEGMNYDQQVNEVYVHYGSLEYLREHWEQETQLMRRWCELVGVEPLDFVLPTDQSKALEIRFRATKYLEHRPIEPDSDDADTDSDCDVGPD